MHDLYISEIYRPGAVFLPLIVWVTSTQRALEKAIYGKNGALRSFEVIEISINRKPVRDFLLVFRCNYMPIFCCLRYITICWSKLESLHFCRYSLDRLKPSERGSEPWDLGYAVGLTN